MSDSKEPKPDVGGASCSSDCYLADRVLLEIPTDGESLYKWVSLSHLPRIGDEVVLLYPDDIVFDDVMVESVRHHFSWRCVVVVLSELDLGESREIENKFKADGWMDYNTMISSR